MEQGRKVLGGEIIYTSEGYRKEPVYWQALGNALHAVQDSFSEGHALRGSSQDEMNPGDIQHIKQYVGTEKTDHDIFDDLWYDADNKRFTVAGRQAINATKLLIIIITRAAQSTELNDSNPTLVGWEQYKNKWLVASNEHLSKGRDFAFDFVVKHQTGIRFGASNIKTLNMDEDAVAKNLILEIGVDMKKVHDVFKRLDEHYNSDTDDIALLYINKVKKENGAIQASLKNNKDLIQLLIKIFEEGYTPEDEEHAIQYLKFL